VFFARLFGELFGLDQDFGGGELCRQTGFDFDCRFLSGLEIRDDLRLRV